jgi:hypothetical protein
MSGAAFEAASGGGDTLMRLAHQISCPQHEALLQTQDKKPWL